VTNNRVLRTMRMAVLSTLFALAAFSLLAFGSASAQTISRAQTASSSTPITVHISDNLRGLAVFSPTQITVKIGASVTIINSTKVRQVVSDTKSSVFFTLLPGASKTIIPQFPQEQLTLSSIGPIGPGAILTITVVL
jgi:hypothetical protein